MGRHQNTAPSFASLRQRIARAVYASCAIPGAEVPRDRAILRIVYPAQPARGKEQLDSGFIPADVAGAPYPVVVIMPGINVGPEAYAWLARYLALRGRIAVTYAFVAEELAGCVSLTPGLDLSALAPATYGSRPSGSAIAPILDAVGRENEGGVLKGCVDVDSVILAGHSAGGSVALYNANPEWFPQVRGAFAYAAHSGASTMLGFDENTILPLPGERPLLLAAGTRDGVIANSAHRYGGMSDPVRATFEQGITRDRGDCYLVKVEGANHFSIAWPADEASGRHYLDETEGGEGESIRRLLAALLDAFIADTVNASAQRMRRFVGHALVAEFCRR